MLRIGRYGIVSFTNYAYWRARWDLLARGRMPTTRCLPEPWYATANIHPCTLDDFELLCAELGVTIERRTCLAAGGTAALSRQWLAQQPVERAGAVRAPVGRRRRCSDAWRASTRSAAAAVCGAGA